MDAEEAKELMALPGAKERLELTQADLMDYGSLAEVFMGCYGVFHTASPSDLVSNYPVNPQSHHLNSLLCYFSADFIDVDRWVLIAQVFCFLQNGISLELETLDSTSFQLQLRTAKFQCILMHVFLGDAVNVFCQIFSVCVLLMQDD
jgi:hypothetical protein